MSPALVPHIYGHDVEEREAEKVLSNPGENRPGREGLCVAVGKTSGMILATNFQAGWNCLFVGTSPVTFTGPSADKQTIASYEFSVPSSEAHEPNMVRGEAGVR